MDQGVFEALEWGEGWPRSWPLLSHRWALAPSIPRRVPSRGCFWAFPTLRPGHLVWPPA